MTKKIPSAFASLCIALLVPSNVLAQEPPRSWLASPDVYKIIGENALYRIILGTWKPGQVDNQHSHTAGAIVYLTDCNIRHYPPAAAPVDTMCKAGGVRTIPAVPSHHVQNIGSADCQMMQVEQK